MNDIIYTRRCSKCGMTETPYATHINPVLWFCPVCAVRIKRQNDRRRKEAKRQHEVGFAAKSP